jgi:hypothetical protein
MQRPAAAITMLGWVGSEGRQARSVDDRCDLSEGASDGRQPLKKGAVPRRIGAHQGRSELEAPRRLRWQGAPAHYAAERRADERLPGRGTDDRRLPEGQGPAR